MRVLGVMMESKRWTLLLEELKFDRISSAKMRSGSYELQM